MSDEPINILSRRLSKFFTNTDSATFDYNLYRNREANDKTFYENRQKSFKCVCLSGRQHSSPSAGAHFFDFIKLSDDGIKKGKIKIWFIGDDEFMNGPNGDPFATEDEGLINMYTSMAREAIITQKFSNISYNDLLTVERRGDDYYVTEHHSDQSSFLDVFSGGSESSPSQTFKRSPGGLINKLFRAIKSPFTSLDEPEVKFTGKRRYSKTKSVNMEGKTYRPYIRRYVGQAQKYKNTDIENGVKISDLHVKIIGFTENHSPFFLPDLVDGFKQMCEAYEAKFGKKIRLTDGFRSWKGQIRTRKNLPDAAARPGTSNHGWGLAFDWDTTDSNGTAGYESETYKWMLQNAPKYGFHNPFWAQKPNGWPKVKKAPKGQKGSKPEWWHFEWKFPGKLFK